jgi:uncharacterized RDD family membrane protein YckC
MASPQLVGDPTAVIGRRVVAAVIDGVAIVAPGIAIATSQMEYITRERVGSGFDDFCDTYMEQQDGTCVQFGDRAYFDDSAGGPGPFVGIGLALLLLVVLQGLTGWTIGKLLTGLRTVKEDGSAPGISKALLRWVLLVIDGLPCIPLVGFICALTTQGHRRVGDMAAKTFVVKRSAAGQPILVPGLTQAPVAMGAPAAWGAPGAGGVAAPNVPPQAPQWDAARGTYIQWDPALQRWLQWDEAARTWSPIDGQ